MRRRRGQAVAWSVEGWHLEKGGGGDITSSGREGVDGVIFVYCFTQP
jgi:hypothetical protein